MIASKKIVFDSTWSLFLDRDGVINKRLPGQYVVNYHQFEFESGALEAIASCSKLFQYLFVVTNQQGVGKGLMTHEDLQEVHELMIRDIQNAGGWLDNVYYSPDLASDPYPTRKPHPQMALQAQSDYPFVDFKKSIMVGDSISDMEFGLGLGMTCVFITSKQEDTGLLLKNKKYQDVDANIAFKYATLGAFVKDLEQYWDN